MKITVRFFASYADGLGRSTIELPLAEGGTVRDLMRSIAALPGAALLPPNPLIAVNQVYAPLSSILATGDEVAVIPPVAGG